MKIGIITFHWATNYGAILQSFALQTILQKMGHTVEIINYKPKKYDPSLWRFIRNRHFLHPAIYFRSLKKEQKMVEFRKKYLCCSKRYYSIKDLQCDCKSYDVLISGSDQVMNPSFLADGERGGSGAYFLDFGHEGAAKISYAVSFGTPKYPKQLLPKASPLIKKFKALSVREKTGVEIIESMGRADAVVTPDPTLLFQAQDYDSLLNIKSADHKGTLVYMLHNRLHYIKNKLPENFSIVKSESIEEWVGAIKNSSHVITNSFHGMVFAILYHVPFTVVLPDVCNKGMNDRFFTLLSNLGIEDRIIAEYDIDTTIMDRAIDWEAVDIKMQYLRNQGLNFLRENI